MVVGLVVVLVMVVVAGVEGEVFVLLRRKWTGGEEVCAPFAAAFATARRRKKCRSITRATSTVG